MPKPVTGIIARRSAEGHFTQVANTALRDKRISYRARGVLAAMLTHAPGTRFGKDWILANGPEGREAITSTLRELRSFGYCSDVYAHDEQGKITGRVLVFSDHPGESDHETGNPSYRIGTVGPETLPTADLSLGKPGPDRRSSRRTLDKKEEQVEVEPPVSPASGETDRQEPAPLAVVPDPPPAKPSRRRPPTFSPGPDDVPAGLLPVEKRIRDFWADKSGARSAAAWNALMAGLDRIRLDPDGGTAVVAEQLDAGIQCAWASVTYANWVKYGKPRPTRYASQTATPRGPDAWDAVTAFANWRDELQQPHTPEPMRYAV